MAQVEKEERVPLRTPFCKSVTCTLVSSQRESRRDRAAHVGDADTAYFEGVLDCGRVSLAPYMLFLSGFHRQAIVSFPKKRVRREHEQKKKKERNIDPMLDYSSDDNDEGDIATAAMTTSSASAEKIDGDDVSQKAMRVPMQHLQVTVLLSVTRSQHFKSSSPVVDPSVAPRKMASETYVLGTLREFQQGMRLRLRLEHPLPSEEKKRLRRADEERKKEKKQKQQLEMPHYKLIFCGQTRKSTFQEFSLVVNGEQETYLTSQQMEALAEAGSDDNEGEEGEKEEED